MTTVSQVWVEDIHRQLSGIVVRVGGHGGGTVSLLTFIHDNEDLTVDDLLSLLGGHRLTFGGGRYELFHAEVIR